MAGALNPTALAARELRERTPELAAAVTDALYAARPELSERYGVEGRRKCLQDMHYNLEHLAPSVELQRPDLFADYARWLDDLLRARGVPTDDVIDCLRLTLDAVTARFPADEAAPIVASLNAGLAALAR